MELETLQIVIEANAEKVKANLDKVVPYIEAQMKKIEGVTKRGIGKTEGNLSLEKSVEKLSDQVENMTKKAKKQMDQLDKVMSSATSKASASLVNGISKGRRNSTKEIDAMIKEIEAKMNQARAKQQSFALQQAHGNAASTPEAKVRFDNQAAKSYADMVKFQDQAKKLAKELNDEFNQGPQVLDQIAEKMQKNEYSIDRMKKKVAMLNEQYQSQLQPVGSFSKGFAGTTDTAASLKTAEQLEKVRVQMNKAIAENDALANAYGRTEDRVASLRERLGDLNKNLDAGSIKIGNARQGIGSIANKADEASTQTTRWGGVWNRVSNALAHGGRRLKSLGGQIDASGIKTNRFGSIWNRLGNQISRILGRMKRGFGNADGSSRRFFGRMNRDTRRSTRGLLGLNRALTSIGRRLIVFGLMYRGISALGSYMLKALKTNDQFANSLNQIKVNLATAFYPIFTRALPAINALMAGIAKVTGYIASFIATIFGTTYSAAKQGAEDMHDAIGDMDNAANKAKKLQQQLAGFDEINTLNFSQDDDDDSSGGINWNVPEVQTPEWLSNFAREFADIMSRLFDPIQKAWDAQGKRVMDAFKYSLGEIWGLTKEIGKSFMEVWENGTGQRFVENLLILLADVLYIIGDIARAFKNAWVDDGRGTALIQSIFDALNSVLELLHEIGQSFRNAWNDGTGEKIAANLLEIFTNIFNVVSGLADQFKKAWVEGGTGDSIMSGILKLVLTVFETINKMTGATANWAKTLDFRPLLKSIDKLLKAMVPFAENIGAGLLWFYENVLLPLASFVIQDVIPKFLDILSAAIRVINETIEALKPLGTWLWEHFLKPLASWTGGVIVAVLEGIAKALESLAKWISENQMVVELLAVALLSLTAAYTIVKAAVGLWNTIATIAAGVTKALGAAIAFLTSPIGIAIAAIAAIIAIGVLLWKNWDTIKEKAAELGAWISEKWDEIWTKTKEVWENIKKFLSDLWEGLKQTCSNIWEGIKNVFSNFTNFLKGIFSRDWTESFGLIGNVFNSFFKGVSDKWDRLKKIFSGIVDFIAGAFSGDWQRAWDGVKNIVAGVFEGLVNTIKLPLNGIIGMINTVFGNLNKIKIELPKALGGAKIGFNLPKFQLLAKGGILTSATLFGQMGGTNLVGGEAGPEAVIPLTSKVLGGIGEGIASTMGAFSEVIMPEALSSPFPSFELSGDLMGNKFDFSSEELKRTIAEAIMEGFESIQEFGESGDIIIPVSIGTDQLDQILLTNEDRRHLRSNR
ncbi:phage tail tape measure protein, TP901 family [Enterococcus faecium 13.SD.W.09]|nr:phage tail tape measure protein, TP901 family [Enterococcus faecium 13.SD.W.09]